MNPFLKKNLSKQVSNLIPIFATKPLQLISQKQLVYCQQLPTRFISSVNSSNNLQIQNIYVYDETQGVANSQNLNKYVNRSYTCGELSLKNVGEAVVLCGWLEYLRMNKFLVLRDAYGETQVLINDEHNNLKSTLENISYESIIKIEGTVVARPQNMVNKKQVTGEIEILLNKLHILNKASDNLPFNIREFQKAKEALRMQYRYLDLRFAEMQRNMRVRSRMLMDMRDFLINKCGFVDVETPSLFKATPGGAQEFIVPTRFPGQFYSLVQSPQQFKQMLMAGAIDRYFQVARCYRDEGSRSDRQPEFTQLDLELSFVDMNGVLQLVEELLHYSWPKFLEPLTSHFERMTYENALEQYGSDKPDIRFDFKLTNCTHIFKNIDNQSNTHFGAYYILFGEEYSILTKSIKTKLKNISKQYPGARFVQSKSSSANEFVNSIQKLVGESVAANLAKEMGFKKDSVVFLAYGDKSHAQALLGKIRLEFVNYLQENGKRIIKDGMRLLWITDFPLFEVNSESDALVSAHHPFTAPNPDDAHLLKTSPTKVRALAYDLVLNGNEIGGGSIRIHSAAQQEQILKLLNIDKTSLQHMLDMLNSGCPPHGGIALGLDRLLAVILNTPSIRDVIAFPKTFEGRDPLSGAPSPISEEDKKLYHIKSVE